MLPPTVLAETCYWVNEHGRAEVEAALLDAVAERLGVRQMAPWTVATSRR